MYHLLQIKVSKRTSETSSSYVEKIFKIRDFSEMTEIDYWEWNELKNLWVQELTTHRINGLVEILKKIKKIEKDAEKKLSKQK